MFECVLGCSHGGQSHFFFHIHVGFRGWTQVPRLALQTPLPTKSSYCLLGIVPVQQTFSIHTTKWYIFNVGRRIKWEHVHSLCAVEAYVVVCYQFQSGNTTSVMCCERQLLGDIST